MVLPLVGLGAMAAGTGLSMYGTMQRDRATRGALGDYRNALAAHLAAQRAALDQEGAAAEGAQRESQQNVGTYINDVTSARPTDDGFMARVGHTVRGAQTASPTNAGSPLYQGAPLAQANAQQSGILSGMNQRLAQRLMSAHQDRQMAAKTGAADSRKQLGDALLAAKGGDITARFKLADALRDLDWQKQTAQMQSNLDSAQRKGQWATMLGGLGQQAGGLMATYELGQGGAGGPPAAGSYGINSPGALDISGASSTGMA